MMVNLCVARIAVMSYLNVWEVSSVTEALLADLQMEVYITQHNL